MKKVILIYLTLICFTSLSQQITTNQIWKNYVYSTNYVSGFRSMSDGNFYTALERNNTSKNYNIVKASFKDRDGSKEILVHGNDLFFKGMKIVIGKYYFNKDENKILIATNVRPIYRRSYKATFYIYDLVTKKISPLSNKNTSQQLAQFSPDGNQVAYVSNNNIYIKNLKNNKTIQVTFDGKKNNIINGSTDWVYEEEFAVVKAFYWSPKGTKLAYLKFDESKVKEFTMKFYLDLYPEIYNFKYPKAGEDNSKVSLHFYDIKKKKSTTVKINGYEYIPRIKWTKNDNQLMVLTLNRHQNKLDYKLITYLSKCKIDEKTIYSEKDLSYVEIDDNLIFLKDNSFIRTSEKNGFNHIYKIDFEGKSSQITYGKWDVISFLGIDENNRIYYTSAEEGAIYQGIYRVDLNGENKTKISIKKGHNSPTFSSGMKYFMNSYSNASTPPIYTLNDQNGKEIEVLENNLELNLKLDKLNLQKKEFFKIKGQTDSLNCWMIKPPNFDSNKKYPVYYNVYCGPGKNTVEDNWEGNNYMYHQLLAQKGYIVFSVDPRGTMFRGSKFKKMTYLKLGNLETEDMIATAKELSKLPYVDSERIGIMGWSYGAYISSLCITKGAEFFKMAIAVAPVTNWRYYDNIYTERFMRTPKENNDGYDDNSPIKFVNQIKGSYLLIHGSGDDNVHIQNTMEMVKALVSHNKQFDLFIYPNKNHGIYGGNTRLHLYNKMLNFTIKNL